MMFGTREEFQYFQCLKCECLQIGDYPENLGEYYPVTYNAHSIEPSHSINKIRAFLLKQRYRNALFNRGHKINKILSPLVLMRDLRVDGVLPFRKILKVGNVRDFSARILDVGCGSWSLWLQGLKSMGFKNLMGVDPFISRSIEKFGIRILNKPLTDIDGKFDLITFHHSLEHIYDQQIILSCARHLLAPEGVIVIRIPVVSSFTWEKYGVNWAEMDPPRHLYLHSKKSVNILAEQVKLELFETLYDSSEFEFYASEQYQRDIPLNSETSYWRNESSSIFSEGEISSFQRLAEQVNRNGTSGRAAFFFRCNGN